MWRRGTTLRAVAAPRCSHPETKYESGSGWPSFWTPSDEAIEETRSGAHGMVRTEVRAKLRRISDVFPTVRARRPALLHQQRCLEARRGGAAATEATETARRRDRVASRVHGLGVERDEGRRCRRRADATRSPRPHGSGSRRCRSRSPGRDRPHPRAAPPRGSGGSGGELVGLARVAALPDRPDRVHDVAGGQPEAGGVILASPVATAAEGRARGVELGSGGGEDRPHTPAPRVRPGWPHSRSRRRLAW